MNYDISVVVDLIRIKVENAGYKLRQINLKKIDSEIFCFTIQGADGRRAPLTISNNRDWSKFVMENITRFIYPCWGILCGGAGNFSEPYYFKLYKVNS
jgi:hypothetical protein